MWSSWWDNPERLQAGSGAVALDELAAALVERYEPLQPILTTPTPWRTGNGRELSEDLQTMTEGVRSYPVRRGAFYEDSEAVSRVVVDGSVSVKVGTAAGDLAGTYRPTGRNSQAWRLQGPLETLALSGGAELHREGDSFGGGMLWTVDFPSYDREVSIEGLRATINGIRYRCLGSTPIGRQEWRESGGAVVVLFLGLEDGIGSPVWEREDGTTVRLWRRRWAGGWYADGIFRSPDGQWQLGVGVGVVSYVSTDSGRLYQVFGDRESATAPARLFDSSAKYRMSRATSTKGGLWPIADYLRLLRAANWAGTLDTIPATLPGVTPLNADWIAEALQVRTWIRQCHTVYLAHSFAPSAMQYTLTGGSGVYKQVTVTSLLPCLFSVLVDGSAMETSETYLTSWTSSGTFDESLLYSGRLKVTAGLQLEYQ